VKLFKLNDRIDFGKHRGLTIKEIIEDDPTYLEWALDEVGGFELDDVALEALERALGRWSVLWVWMTL
jgi:hypothetical protein